MSFRGRWQGPFGVWPRRTVEDMAVQEPVPSRMSPEMRREMLRDVLPSMALLFALMAWGAYVVAGSGWFPVLMMCFALVAISWALGNEFLPAEAPERLRLQDVRGRRSSTNSHTRLRYPRR